MIQSVKFDSSNMDIKKLANIALNFIIARLIEITGITVSILGLILLISLLSYSPNDPNFIFPENNEIKNLLGFRGSYISDLFFSISWNYFISNICYFYIYRYFNL